MANNNIILSAKDVEIQFSLRGKTLNAIRKCSLDLYEGETLEYYFVEDNKESQVISEKETCCKENIIYEDGKYGRLNLISRLSKEKRYESMLHYKKEEQVAEEMFPTY